MLNKISFSQNKENQKINNIFNAENVFKAMGSGIAGAGGGTLYYHAVTKDKFIKEKAAILQCYITRTIE